MDLSKLKEPFPAEDIEWRLQSCDKSKNGSVYAICLAYVTNRAICNRLDEVVGPENWKNEFITGPNGGILCGLSIKVDGEWITKFDGAENTNIEPVKGGLSGAMKRSASTGWGIGRYLYYLDEGFAKILPENSKEGLYGKTKDGTKFKWLPPELPDWALPNGSGKPPAKTSKSSSKSSPTPPSEEDKKKCEELKSKLMDYEDVIPKDSWKDIEAAIQVATPESIAFLNQMLSWACKEARNKAS